MKLSMEELEHIKKWYAKCEADDYMPENGVTIGRLLNTIEAQQQELERLRAQAGDMKDLLSIIDSRRLAGEQAKDWVANNGAPTPLLTRLKNAIHCDATDYRPVDKCYACEISVENEEMGVVFEEMSDVLKKAREVLTRIVPILKTSDIYRHVLKVVREAIVEIDKVLEGEEK